MDERDDDLKMPYEVGYAKPPVAQRFKKGKSGNPSGKAKRPPTTESAIRKVLKKRVVVTENGKRKRIPVTEAVMTQLVQRALGGDIKSQREYLKIAREEGEPRLSLLSGSEHEAQIQIRYYVDLDKLARALIQLSVLYFEDDRIKIDPEFLYAHLGREFEDKPHKHVRDLINHYYPGTPPES